jgi:hypothetical protein
MTLLPDRPQNDLPDHASDLSTSRPVARHIDPNAPVYEPIDFAGLAAACVITLGPLAAYAYGFGA